MRLKKFKNQYVAFEEFPQYRKLMEETKRSKLSKTFKKKCK